MNKRIINYINAPLMIFTLLSWSVIASDLDCELGLTPLEKQREILLSNKNFEQWLTSIENKSIELETMFKNGALEKRVQYIDAGINGQDIESLKGPSPKFRLFKAEDTTFRHYSREFSEIIFSEKLLRAGPRPFINPEPHLRKEYLDLTGVFMTRPEDNPERLWLGVTLKTPHVDFKLPKDTPVVDLGEGNFLIIGPPSVASWIADLYRQFKDGKTIPEHYKFPLSHIEDRGGLKYPLTVPIFLAGANKEKQNLELVHKIEKREVDLEKYFHLPANYARWYFQKRVEPTLRSPSYEYTKNPPVLYRGMFITLQQLKTILKEGMKLSEVRWGAGDPHGQSAGVSFSSSITEASSYIFHNAHEKFESGKGVGVIFRIRTGSEYKILEDDQLNSTKTIYKKYSDVESEEIDAVYLWGEYGPENLESILKKNSLDKIKPQSEWVTGEEIFNR
jgi:hypothetical protein